MASRMSFRKCLLNSNLIHVCDIMINLKMPYQFLEIRLMTFAFDNCVLTSLMTHEPDPANPAWIAFIVILKATCTGVG